MNRSEARVLAMVSGWIMALYGVCRRDWPGTIIAMTGIVIAEGAMTLTLGEDEKA